MTLRPIAATLMALLVTGLLPAANASFEGQERILFSSNRAGTFDIYSMNADGTDVRPVLGGPLDEYEVDVSPDGGRIVYVRSVGLSCCGPTADLWISNVDGSEARELFPADPLVDDYRPDWSPDGTRIAFSRGAGGGSSNIFSVDPGGGDLRAITNEVAGNNFASWSPDGERLVFLSSRDGRFRLWVTDADGGNQHPITDPPTGALETTPQWSPTDDVIVFKTDKDSGTTNELYTVRSDGSELTRVTIDEADDRAPAWSPDGAVIVYSSVREVQCSILLCPGQLWTVGRDGSNPHRLTEGPFHDTFPAYLRHN